MIDLTDQEAYCSALVIANGGNMEIDMLKDIILHFRESFGGLDEKYVKYKLVKKILTKLVEKRILSKNEEQYSTKSNIDEEFLVKKYASHFIRATKNLRAFKEKIEEDIIKFDLYFAKETILSDDWEEMPWELQSELRGAIDIIQKTEEFDAVITKCGRCVEIMVKELDQQYAIFTKKRAITRMISELIDEATIERFSDDREKRETFRVFAYAVYTIYRFRNKMGAHSDWGWGNEEIAVSCLILTLYIADLYCAVLRKTKE